ncbi:hypothetical protein ABPG72_011955 [Tetrahymena utriculariae]
MSQSNIYQSPQRGGGVTDSAYTGYPANTGFNYGNISPNKNTISRLQNQNLITEGDQAQLTVNPRIVYLRKLYFALFMQLLIIGIFALFVHVYVNLRAHLQQNYAYFWVSLAGAAIIGILGLFFRQAIRKSPINYICMFLWTIFFGIVLVYAVSINKDSIVGLMIFVLLASLMLSQFLYTLTVRYELTYQGTTLFVFGAQILNFHIFTLFTNLSFYQMIIISFFGFIFAFYLIFDTQSRVAGPDYDFNKEEWRSGTVLVYMDVFLLILRIGDLLRTMLTKKQD